MSKKRDLLDAERKKLDAMRPAARTKALLDALSSRGDGIGWEEALARLIEMGSEAVPHLIEALPKRKLERWQIACALGRIGPARAGAAIPALRRYANDESDGSNWCAMALAFLGDGPHLVELARNGCGVAITGLCGALRAFADEAQRDSGERIPLRYDHLEELLAFADEQQKKAVETELKPGNSYRWELDALDVDTAVEALESRHAVVRWHAASVLGHMKLRKKAAAPVMDALVKRVADRSKLVRRLAMLSLERHRRHLGPAHLRAMAVLADDADEVTKSVGERARKELELMPDGETAPPRSHESAGAPRGRGSAKRR
jgi:HEAT repeat protein